MKAEIIILLSRDYTVDQINKMTGYSKSLIYYYNTRYKKGIEKIKEYQNKITG